MSPTLNKITAGYQMGVSINIFYEKKEPNYLLNIVLNYI